MNTFGRKPGFPSSGMIESPARVPAEVVEEKILEFLGTDKSCTLVEIARAVELPENQIKNILDFLVEANMVEKRFGITGFGLRLLEMPIG
jgi:predicted ArsR family transcriptional regulator